MKHYLALFLIVVCCFCTFYIEDKSIADMVNTSQIFSIENITALGNPTNTILIIGSEPECIAAASQAYKLGYKVVMVSEDKMLGGLMTSGMLSIIDLNYDDTGHILHEGFTAELLAAASNGSNLDVQATEHFFYDQMNKDKIEYYTEATEIIPIVKQRQVVGAQFCKNSQDRKSVV